MIEKLKNFLKENDVDFSFYNGEIIIPVPADLVPLDLYDTEKTMDEIISNEQVTVYTDEAFVHIAFNEDEGFSWLIELPNFDD